MGVPHEESTTRRRIEPAVLATAVVLTCGLIAGAALWFAGNGRAPAAGASRSFWLVLRSTRDGVTTDEYGGSAAPHAYSLRPDGSRLTRLLGTHGTLDPLGVSADGRTIAYGESGYPRTIYLSRADGTGLHRVADAGPGRTVDSPVLSPDGSALAFIPAHPGAHVLVVGSDGGHRQDLGRGFDPQWSPDGEKLVFQTAGGCAVVRSPALPGWLARATQALQGDGRVFLPGKCESPEWSPDGRWIAFEAATCPLCESKKKRAAARKHAGLWVIRPNGEDRRRVGPVDEYGSSSPYSWSPDSTRVAFVTSSGIFVTGVAGHPKRLRPRDELSPSASSPIWSADGRRIMLAASQGADAEQIWSLRPDGTGLRRLTGAGANDLVGVARLAPARPPAAPLPPNERVLGPRTLETARPVDALAADGARVAYTTRTTPTDCRHVSVWTPSRRSFVRVSRHVPAPCEEQGSTLGYTIYSLVIAGSLVGWADTTGCGNYCETEFVTAVLPGARPVPGSDKDGGGGGGGGELPRYRAAGHGNVFVLDSTVTVDPGSGSRRSCRLPRKSFVASVAGRLIVVREPAGITVLDDSCAPVRIVPFARGEVRAALLEGDRLTISRAGSLETYDVGSGALLGRRPLPAGYVLADAARGIALVRHGRSIRLLRLGDGRAITFRPCRGPVDAEIEPAGLYYSYATVDRRGRLVLVPWAQLERRLASGADSESACARSSENYATDGEPASTAIADLNHDGKPDLVTADEGGGVSVRLNGGRKFQSRREYRTIDLPHSVAVGDLNGDGNADLATADADANAVSVLLNKGGGTFAAPRRYRAGRFPDAIAIGDLNRDGKNDVAVADQGSNGVSVLLNRGHGKLAPPVRYRVGEFPYSVAIGDLNGDGAPDLVVGHADKGDSLTVLLGKSDGTFGRADRYETDGDVNSIAIADLDGNGRLDIVAAGNCSVSVLFDRGHGTFGGARTLRPSAGCATSVAITDLDGDGKPDLAIAAGASPYPNAVSVLLNRGGDRFDPAGRYETRGHGVTGGGLAVGDLNGDGRPDLASANYDDNSIAVLVNTLGACAVHALGGKSETTARAALGRVHCRVDKISRAYSKTVTPGRVIGAEPRFGAYWPNGPEVDVVLSRGPHR